MIDDRCMIEFGRGGRRPKMAAHSVDFDSSRFVSHQRIVLLRNDFSGNIVQENRALRNDSQCEATGLNDSSDKSC